MILNVFDIQSIIVIPIWGLFICFLGRNTIEALQARECVLKWQFPKNVDLAAERLFRKPGFYV